MCSKAKSDLCLVILIILLPDSYFNPNYVIINADSKVFVEKQYYLSSIRFKIMGGSGIQNYLVRDTEGAFEGCRISRYVGRSGC